jgi:glycosyltransferase involved in cell wall biosynthesis
MTTVDVVIPVFNGARFVVNVIDSVSKQSHPINQIIVVNDGSTDETPLILRNLLSKHQNLQVIEADHCGLSAARNMGWRTSRADYISFLDVDDSWSTLKIENQLRHLQTHPNCEVAFSNTILINESNSKRIKLSGSTEISASPLNLLTKRFVVAGSASSVILRRDLLDRMNGFDQTLKFGEDLDLWIRISEITDFCCISDFDVFILKTRGGMQSNVTDIEKVFKHNILILELITRYVDTQNQIQYKKDLTAAFWGDLRKNIRHGHRDLRSIYKRLSVDFPDVVQVLFPTFGLFLRTLIWAFFSRVLLRVVKAHNE